MDEPRIPPTPSSPAQPPDPWRGQVQERLTRVEEACGFAQHDVEQLGAEVTELSRRLTEALRRLDALERRLTSLASPPEGGESEPAA